jgi:hypothetical protein
MSLMQIAKYILSRRGSFKNIIITSLLLFVFITLLTGAYHSAGDGFNALGFPFTFYQSTAGKCQNCDLVNWFKASYFISDLLLCFLVCWIGTALVCIATHN